jgi:NADH-quinone oxidoreductase E subunit
MNEVFDAKVVDGFIDRYGKQTSSLIQVLQDIQSTYRYLPEDAIKYVAEKLELPLSRAYNVATFYNAFSLKPVGKRHVCVCMGTACHVRGGQNILDNISSRVGVKPGETTDDGEYTLDTVNCVGACALAPVVMVNDDVHGGMDGGGINRMFKRFAKN